MGVGQREVEQVAASAEQASNHPSTPADGVVVVDKPTGWTSHDVVAKIRRLARTRRVGHAGTLDPMATGVLVLGVGRATRLLGHLALTQKTYEGTMRLGQSTDTDDATGTLTGGAAADHVGTDAVVAAAAELTGEIDQVPSTVSAVKQSGQRAYKRARAGREVDLRPRRVTVSRFEVLDVRRTAGLLDVQVRVGCSSGTYVRALARDLGSAVGVGGHLTALRRTRVGAYDLSSAHSIEELHQAFALTEIAEVAAANFPRLSVDEDTARLISFGQKLPGFRVGTGPVAMFAPDGAFLALYEDVAEGARPVAVFAG